VASSATSPRSDLPQDHVYADPDLDKASLGIVKVPSAGRTGTASPGLPCEGGNGKPGRALMRATTTD
jgi:hypothetical protein